MSALPDKSARRYELDCLRILATLLLIPYHTARIFDPHPYYVKSEISSSTLDLFTKSIDIWFMPLFFFIAGAAAKYSLDSRSQKQYLWERFQRLFIPFIFGIFVFIPPIGYVAFFSKNPNIYLPYNQYYLSFFELNYKRIDGYTGTFTPSHLWFILYLFCFSLIALPLFQFLKIPKIKHFVAKLADSLLQIPMSIFLVGIPLALARMAALVYYNPIYLILFFILGYLFLLDRRFEDVFQKNSGSSLILAALGMLFYLYLDLSEFSLFKNRTFMNSLIQLILSLTSWCWIIVILNFASKYLRTSNSFIAYLNQASYPIYILHMTFIMAIGFYVVQWKAGIAVEFLTITIASTLSMLLFYDFCVKRFNVTRFLLGMKLKN